MLYGKHLTEGGTLFLGSICLSDDFNDTVDQEIVLLFTVGFGRIREGVEGYYYFFVPPPFFTKKGDN